MATTTTEQIYIKMNLDTRQFDNTITGIKREMASLRGIVGSNLLSPQENSALTARLGQLKNDLDDIKIAANNIDVGDVFGNAARFAGVAANSVAGVTAAMSLLGIESEKVGEVEKRILQFMAIGNSLQAVADSKRLGALAAIYGQKIKDLFITKELIAAEKEQVIVQNANVGGQVSEGVVDTTLIAQANAAANIQQAATLQALIPVTQEVIVSKEELAAADIALSVALQEETLAGERLELEQLKLQLSTDKLKIDQEELAIVNEQVTLTTNDIAYSEKRLELLRLEQIKVNAALARSEALNASLSKGATAAKQELTIAERNNLLIKEANSLATVKAAFAQGGYVVGVKAAIAATIAWTKALIANPLTWFVASIAAVVLAIYGLYKAFTYVTEAQKENLRIMKLTNDERVRTKKIMEEVGKAASDTLVPQRVHVENLVRAIRNENASLLEKKKALKELIALDPKYLEGLTLANINTQKGKDIIANYISALGKKAESMALESQLVKLYSDKYTESLEYENYLIGIQADKLRLANLEKKPQVTFGRKGDIEDLEEKIKKEEEYAKAQKTRLDNNSKMISNIETKLGNMKPLEVQYNTGQIENATNEKNKKIEEIDKISEKGKWDWALSQYRIYLYEQEQLKQKAREESDAAEMKVLEEENDQDSEAIRKRMEARSRAIFDVIAMENEANENAGNRIYEYTKMLNEKYINDRKQIFGGLFTVFDELNYDEKLMAFSEFAVSVTEITANSINAIMEVQMAKNQELFDQSMTLIGEQYDRSIKQIDDALRYGTLTQQEYDKRKEVLDKERVAKENKLKKEQGEANKKAAIARAVISTAQAVISALAQWPGVPLTIPYGILAGILGGIQIAAIKATPIPQYALGGPITGLPHSQGGVPLYAEGGEYIINKKVAQSPGMGNFLNKVNKGEIQPGQTQSSGIDVDTIKSIVAETVAGISSIPVINVESDTTRVQRKVANIESKSNW